MLFNISCYFIFYSFYFWCFMLVLNHSNEENGKRRIVFVYIKQNLSVAFDYNIQQCNFQTARV